MSRSAIPVFRGLNEVECREECCLYRYFPNSVCVDELRQFFLAVGGGDGELSKHSSALPSGCTLNTCSTLCQEKL